MYHKQNEDCVGSTRLAVMVIKGGGVEGRNRSGEHGQIKDLLTETVFMRHTQHVQRFCVSFKAGSVLCPGTFEMQTRLWKFTDISLMLSLCK